MLTLTLRLSLLLRILTTAKGNLSCEDTGVCYETTNAVIALAALAVDV